MHAEFARTVEAKTIIFPFLDSESLKLILIEIKRAFHTDNTISGFFKLSEQDHIRGMVALSQETNCFGLNSDLEFSWSFVC